MSPLGLLLAYEPSASEYLSEERFAVCPLLT